MVPSNDQLAIEAILARQGEAWKAGDADAFGADALEGVLFTNIVGMFSIGRAPFVGQHAHIFATIYRGSEMEQEIAAITLVRPDVAIVDTICALRGARHLPPGIVLIEGAVRTRLEQVMVREADGWKVAAFHNVAVQPLPPASPLTPD